MVSRAAKTIKCVVWDLDNTLWDGIFLEAPEVTLRPQIREIVEELDRRGILQSIASKNDFAPVYQKLEELNLADYFLYPQINWNAKSHSIATIQQRLNIGMDTFLFLDDQAFERDEVNSVYPEVLCLSPAACENLLSHPRLTPMFVTEETRRRRLMYQQDQLRLQEEEAFEGPHTAFLVSLGMQFIICEAQEEDLQRAEELTVRTNQLNSTGITYSYEELQHFRLQEQYKLLVCELVDKYGSYGKIGLALIEINDVAWHMKLLLMSCRVLSRSVGSVLLSYILQAARAEGKVVRADFRRTERNRMMYATYRFANFKEIATDADGCTILENDLTRIQAFPPFIDVQVRAGLGH